MLENIGSVAQIYEGMVDRYPNGEDHRMMHVLYENARRVHIPENARVFLVSISGSENDLFRRYFGELMAFKGAEQIYDIGNMSGELLTQRISQIVHTFPDALVMVIGGNQATAYGEILGLIEGLPDKSIGMGNIGAYLDVGKPEGPFFRLWETHGERLGYHLAFGVEDAVVGPSEFRYLASRPSKVVHRSELLTEAVTERKLHAEFELLFSATDVVTLHVDVGVFGMAFAPGAHRPSVLGLNPESVFPVLRYFAKNPFLKTVGVYGPKPQADIQDRTMRLIAQMAYEVCKARVEERT